MKEVVVVQLAAALSVEKEPPIGGIAKEVGQAVKDAQPISPSISLAVRTLKLFNLLFSRILSPCRPLVQLKL